MKDESLEFSSIKPKHLSEDLINTLTSFEEILTFTKHKLDYMSDSAALITLLLDEQKAKELINTLGKYCEIFISGVDVYMKEVEGLAEEMDTDTLE